MSLALNVAPRDNNLRLYKNGSTSCCLILEDNKINSYVKNYFCRLRATHYADVDRLPTARRRDQSASARFR